MPPTDLQDYRHYGRERTLMVALLRPQENVEQGKIERDYRLIGWWGVALAVLGIAMLAITMVSGVSE